MSECTHTKAGCEFLRQQSESSANVSVAAAVSELNNMISNNEQRESTMRMPTAVTSVGPSHADADHLGLANDLNEEAPIHNCREVSLQQLLETMPMTPAQDGRWPSLPALLSSNFRAFEPQAISAADSILPTPSPPSSLRTFELQNDILPSSPQSMTDEPSNPSLTMSSFSRKRARATRTNPTSGHVVGAMRGSKKLDIIRPQPLRKRMDDQSMATKRFHREMTALIARSERLAEETGCWLVLLGQHSSSGSSATHFTSASLRRDAKEDTLGLVNKFHSMTRALLVAKRQGALDMAKKLVEAQEIADNTKKTLASKEAQLAAALTLIAQHGLTVPPAGFE
ncbi:hypothetical protein F5887DRAFT_918313 [Amanita rubescens]|nr:hypothetical protein F5887DRAFT_918313 [Amanita rubescens]